MNQPQRSPSTLAALDAFDRGFVPLPIRAKAKAPSLPGWSHLTWPDRETVRTTFEEANAQGATNIGVLLGKPSGGLVDVDIDHPRAMRVRDNILRPTPAMSGRVSRPRSHFWYRVTGEGLPSTRQFKMPDGGISVEFRSTGGQTVIPPSVHKDDGHAYQWHGEPWGGEQGPTVLPWRNLLVEVATLGLVTVLIDGWPTQGSRHEAYLALAGGLLRWGDEIHPFWESQLPMLIQHVVVGVDDRDGADARIKESIPTTLTRLREGKETTGWRHLGTLMATPEHAEMARRLVEDLEELALGKRAERKAVLTSSGGIAGTDEHVETKLPPVKRSPMDEREGDWGLLDLDPYLTGKIQDNPPTVLWRTDGQGLMYPGKVNSIYGKSESAKSWIALLAIIQEIARGGRAVYLDFEDEPTTTVSRLLALGVGSDDIMASLKYIHPDGPLAPMQRYAYGERITKDGAASQEVFARMISTFDPTMIVADGMTSLYGLHGHNTNDATSTDVITTWLKQLCRNGRTTVIVIDHTGKDDTNSTPIGAHHKIAMVQGTALQVKIDKRPIPGDVGRLRLLVHKDRPGLVRRASSTLGNSDDQIAGIVTLDSSEAGITRIKIDPLDSNSIIIDGSKAAEKLAAMGRERARLDARDELINRIRRVLSADPEGWFPTGKPLVSALGDPEPSRAEMRTAISLMISSGEVEKSGSTKGMHIRLISR